MRKHKTCGNVSLNCIQPLISLVKFNNKIVTLRTQIQDFLRIKYEKVIINETKIFRTEVTCENTKNKLQTNNNNLCEYLDMTLDERRVKVSNNHPKHEVEVEDLVSCVYFKNTGGDDLTKEYLSRRRPIPTDGTVMFEVDPYGRLLMDCEQGFHRKQVFVGEGVSYETVNETHDQLAVLSNDNHEMKEPALWQMGNNHYDPLIPRQCFKISDNSNFISSVAHSTVQRHLDTCQLPWDRNQAQKTFEEAQSKGSHDLLELEKRYPAVFKGELDFNSPSTVPVEHDI